MNVVVYKPWKGVIVQAYSKLNYRLRGPMRLQWHVHLSWTTLSIPPCGDYLNQLSAWSCALTTNCPIFLFLLLSAWSWACTPNFELQTSILSSHSSPTFPLILLHPFLSFFSILSSHYSPSFPLILLHPFLSFRSSLRFLLLLFFVLNLYALVLFCTLHCCYYLSKNHLRWYILFMKTMMRIVSKVT